MKSLDDLHGRTSDWGKKCLAFLTAISAALVTAACGGGGHDQTLEQQSDAVISDSSPGPSPFIAFVRLTGHSLQAVTDVDYIVSAKPGTVSKPVHVSYTVDSLRRRGYLAAGTDTLIVPVFGLYAGYANLLTVELRYQDGSQGILNGEVTTQPFSDPSAIYDRPVVRTRRTPESALGFDYFAIKNAQGSPVVIDTDGEIRWLLPGTPNGLSSAFDNNGFVVGSQFGPMLMRIELDGTTSSIALNSPTATRFHHNIDPGKFGLIGGIDKIDLDVPNTEANAAEFDKTGTIIARWDFAVLLANYMTSQGDDPTLFVRPKADWFHVNAVTYDPRDDSIIASSRENFLIKLDYRTGNVVWIFGDPTKYWYSFQSLRAKALTLSNSDLYPIGQHSVSITTDGLLLLFNNGAPSSNQPAGASAGEQRAYSAVSAYKIDPVAKNAREVWRFDYGKTVYSPFCSSAYEVADMSLLVDYAVLEGGASARVVGLNRSHEVVFDFQYGSPNTCNGAWNSVPINFESMKFH